MSSTKKSSGSSGKSTVQASAPKSKALPLANSLFGGGFWRKNWIPGLILLLLPFALYFQSTSFGYVLDDKIVLSENAFVKKGTKGMKDIFGKESFTGFLGEQQDLVAGARYRPLSIATFALEMQFFGKKAKDGKTFEGNPSISHTINILLYALTALLIFRIFVVLAPPKADSPWYFSLSFWGALLFVLHPIHTEVVANIKGRDEILALLLSLATLYATLRYLTSNQMLYLIASPVLFLLALLAKENALTFLAVIPLAVVLFVKVPKQKAALATLPLLGAALVFIFIRTSVIGYLLDSGKEITGLMNNPFVDATTGEKYATITYTIGWYLKLLFVPHPLTHDYYPYHVPLVGWGDYRALISLALVLGLIGLSVWLWKKSKLTAFSILYFFITLSMVSNLVFSVGTFMNERFIYMPSVGFCLLIGYVLVQKFPEWLPSAGKAVGLGLLGLMGLAFAARTFTRVPDWKDAASLEAASIKVSFNSARSNQYYAYSLYEKSIVEKDVAKKQALYDEAWPYVNKALEIYPGYTDAHTCRDGIAAGRYQIDGDINKLLPYFENTLRTAPVDFVDQYLDYLSKRGQHVTELTDFFHRVGFGYFWTEKKDAARARKYLEMGLRMAPGDARLIGDLAGLR
ncbi:MAG: DUF1736 domain-containing protein [Bacteroidetes bacterium]|nr:DUF1736 domain-containing protein [Bacteroidota bacterium]